MLDLRLNLARSANHPKRASVHLMFPYTENPPENTISTPAALRVSAVATAYTENSSFPYIRNNRSIDYIGGA